MANINILQELENHLRTEVSPKAVEIDRDPQALKTALQSLMDRKLLAVNIPQEYGGPGFTPQEYHRFKKMLGRYSGALLFLQTQHQTSAATIFKGDNETIKSNYLPDMHNGKHLLGLSFEHLRYWRKPVAIATRCNNGYLIKEITSRFVTGYGFFHELIIAFTAKRGNKMLEILALVPFKNCKQAPHGVLQFSKPMALSVTSSSNTVSVTIKNWFIADDKIISSAPSGSAYQKRLHATNTDSFIAGTTAAVLDLIKTHLPNPLSEITKGLRVFNQKLKQFEKIILARTSDTFIAPIRAQGIQLCDQTLAFARQAFRGRIMLQNDPIAQQLQRLSHERDLFSIAMAGDDLLRETINHSALT